MGRFPISPGVFLGHVLAHQIGQMLLGMGGHAERGLMKPTGPWWITPK
jgi:hypothetical protein